MYYIEWIGTIWGGVGLLMVKEQKHANKPEFVRLPNAVIQLNFVEKKQCHPHNCKCKCCRRAKSRKDLLKRDFLMTTKHKKKSFPLVDFIIVKYDLNTVQVVCCQNNATVSFATRSRKYFKKPKFSQTKSLVQMPSTVKFQRFVNFNRKLFFVFFSVRVENKTV